MTANKEHPLSKQVREARARLAELPDGGASIQLQGTDRYLQTKELDQGELIRRLRNATGGDSALCWEAAALLEAQSKAAPVVLPLTDARTTAAMLNAASVVAEQTGLAWTTTTAFKAGVKFAEAAHGITGEKA